MDHGEQESDGNNNDQVLEITHVDYIDPEDLWGVKNMKGPKYLWDQ